MEITNKTKKPLSIPLPGGKKLHLGPGKTGQVSPKAVDHPALKKLIDAGEVEAQGDDRKSARGKGGGNQGLRSSTGFRGTGGIRQAGDR